MSSEIPTLRPCSHCTRHIQSTESTCPFCNGILSADFADYSHTLPSKRLSRAALVAFGATVALAGCAGSATAGDAGQDAMVQTDNPNAMPEVSVAAYGLPPPMDGGVAPPYGIPPGDF